MGFMDKAKKLVEQAQQEAKDGTLKERAKHLAEQAQHKLDEVQDQLKDRRGGQAPEGTTPPTAPETPPAAGPATPPSAAAPDVDRPDDAPPKMTGGDPLAG